MNKHNESELLDAAGIVYLDPDNCSFSKNGDFLSVKLTNIANAGECPKVSLHRLFPYDKHEEYISVLNEDNVELGIITDLSVFPESTRELLRAELHRKYYICRLKSVTSVRDRFGFSYWKAVSSDGEITFTVRDAHNSIRTSSDGKITISDIDNNRYELEPLESLDKRTRRRIELYV